MKRETKFKLHRRLDQLTAAIPLVVITLVIVGFVWAVMHWSP